MKKSTIKKASLIFTTTIALLLGSCAKSDFNNEGGTVNSFNEITVPAAFNYATSRNVTVDLSILNPKTTSDYRYVAKIYNAAPDKNGTVLVMGAFDNATFSYKEVLNLPTLLNDVYVEIYYGSSLIYNSTTSVVNNAISLTVNNQTTKSAQILTNTAADYILTGYTPISGSNGLNPKDGDKLKISAGATFSGGINYNGNGGTLYLAIEGTANFQYLNVNNGKLEIIVGTEGSISNFNEVKKEMTVSNYSNVLNVSTINGKLKNYSIANIAGSLNINSSGALENYSTLNIGGQIIVNSQSYFLNQGHSNISGSVTINTGGKIDNSCSMVVAGNFNVNGDYTMSEGSYLKINGESRLNSNATATLARDSYLITNTIWNDSQITGPKIGYAIVQYLSSKGGNSKTFFINNVYLIDSNGKDGNGNTISFSIAQNSCSPGYGKPGDNNDRDGDGIDNSLDNFPDDNERAFLIKSGEGTLLFEDQWPNLGDYDFNDLVVAYQYNYITNAKNEITGFLANYQVSAVGASINNGFGFTLPISSDQIKLVKGYSRTGTAINLNVNGTEAGHTNESVVIVYDQLYSVGSMFNVVKGGATKTVPPIQIDISFIGKITLSQLYDLNPFIYVGQDRGKEVHLVGYAPTNLANSSYFGMGDDNTNNTYYKSKKGYPWALNIAASVSHMQEKIDFVKGYYDFAGWVESGGLNNKDWYLKNTNSNALY